MDPETEGPEMITIEARTIAGGVTVEIDEEAARRSNNSKDGETFYQTKEDVMTAESTKLGTIIDP